MDQDTNIGGPADSFPLTRRSLVAAVRIGDPAGRERALEGLVAAYWKPIYKYIRRKWNATNEDAKDLTQGFFATTLEKGFVERYTAQRASFRTYLRVCADGYVSNERKAAGRQKRGGEHQFFSLDFEAVDAEFARSARNGSGEEYFDRECVRSILEQATESLRSTCEQADKMAHFTLFERYDLRQGATDGGPTYEQLAAEVGLTVTQVTNYLAWARQAFRRCVLDVLRERTGDEEEFRDEARRLFGISL